MNNRTRTIITKAGGPVAVAKACGITTQAISAWMAQDQIPADRAPLIERLTGGAYKAEDIAPGSEWIRVRGQIVARKLPVAA